MKINKEKAWSYALLGSFMLFGAAVGEAIGENIADKRWLKHLAKTLDSYKKSLDEREEKLKEKK